MAARSGHERGGPCYDVNAEEVEDQQAFAEKWPKEQFIFDVQTHHVDVERKWYDDTPQGGATLNFFRMLRPRLKIEESLDALNRAHYVKEVFGDSDTVMAVISGVPSRDWDKNPLPPDQMVATRKYVNDLAGSQRVLSHGLLRPNLGAKELDEMERQVKELKIDAWKMYTGAELAKSLVHGRREGGVSFWERPRPSASKPVRPGTPAGVLQREGLHAARSGEGGQGLA
jgi:hypothetical protein